MPNRHTYIELGSAALKHNLSCVRSMVPDADVMAVIKSDGYGHGMAFAAQTLSDADEFAVTSLDDVMLVRGLGIDKPITVLSTQFDKAEAMQFRALNLRPVIYDQGQLEVLQQISDAARAFDVWLKIDTGMGRLGFAPDACREVYQSLELMPCVRSVSLMSHLANADEPNNVHNTKQFEIFDQLSQAAPFVECSLLNSGGIVGNPKQAYQRVRPGVMLYGVSPLKNVSAASLGLKPVMTLKSELISVKTLSAGATIGYAGTSILNSDSRVGIVACGYGDGYPRHARPGTPVLINGHIVPMLGRVSMDMIAVDLSDVSAVVGDCAVLWGDGNPVETVAECAGTIAYELLCGVTQRVHRIDKPTQLG